MLYEVITPAGLGIKFSSRSERTALLKGDAIVDSVWYVYLPGRGSLFIEQQCADGMAFR